MSTNSTIDDLFKDGLSDVNFSNKEAMWKKMEEELDNAKRKKRRFAVIVLLCCLLTGGFFVLKNNTANKDGLTENSVAVVEKKVTELKETNAVVAAKKVVAAEENTATIAKNNVVPTVTNPGKNSKIITTNEQAVVSFDQYNNYKNKPVVNRKRTQHIAGKITVQSSFDIAENEALQAGETTKADGDFSLIPYASSYMGHSLVFTSTHKISIATPKPVVKKNEPNQQKISLEIVAGSDIFNLNKKVGYYGGVRVSRHLDKGTSVSAGINYSLNTLNEKYRLSNKPLQQHETDAQINNLKMLRLPVMFQKQLAKSKFALMAGLIPSYILDASVYNVPTSNPTDPTAFRKFTINDIHRFNVLFGAGIKYTPVKRLAFEISGSYGFTELVKNSYINQSNVNDNFKNIQAGVVFLLK